MVKNKNIASVFKIAFLALYIAYAGSISFFTHTHIVNGVTIVHSHPFQSDDKGNPVHTHTGSEIQLIQNLSSFQTDGQIQCTFTFDIPKAEERILLEQIYSSTYTPLIKGQERLRPPPFC